MTARLFKLLAMRWSIVVLITEHFLDSISFNMADTCWVVCLYKSTWMLHSYKWSFYEL